jgi:hypothetical protein
MNQAIGHFENGAIRLNERVQWADGQRVLVIALPANSVASESPPEELLDEDAREFTVRREAIADINRGELTEGGSCSGNHTCLSPHCTYRHWH